MINVDTVYELIATKARIVAALESPDSGFAVSRRECSEGLTKHMRIGDEVWQYATDGEGYTFSSPDRRCAVYIHPDKVETHTTFTPAELVVWLQNQAGLSEVNAIVVDNWLLKASLRGQVDTCPDQPGAFKLI